MAETVASLTSNAFTNTIVLTTTANVALHGRVWVVIGSNQDLSTFISTVTDQVSNTYACVTVTDSPNGESGAICTGYMSSALPSGDTITFTEANSSNGAFAVAYATSTSATSSNTADTSGTATGTSSTPSATTAGNLTATDNVISISCYNNANTFSSNGTGYTGLDNALNANSYAFSMATQWEKPNQWSNRNGRNRCQFLRLLGISDRGIQMRKLFLLIALAFALGTQAQVSGNFIDLTVHNAPNLPTAASLVSFGTIRGWDIGATMNVLNPSSGTFVWTALDAFLNSSTATSKDLIYTFGYLPTWMSSNPTGACTQGPTGTCYPPSDIGSGNTNFSNFVTALVNHSLASRAAGHGYIKYYEVWNEPNATDVGSTSCPPSCGTWYGTIAQFNTMVATEYSVIHSLDPTAQLIGPALSHSDSASNITFLNDFLSASGSKINAVSGHHYDGFFNPVFSMVNDYNDIIAAESLASLSLPVWYTEGNCSRLQ